MRVAFAFALIITASSAEALTLATGGPGTSGANFLTIGIGARPLAMGGAFSAVDTGVDANAINWNPAALSRLDKANVSASYNSLFQDENQGFLGYAAPLQSGGAWALGVDYLIVSNIQQRTGDTESPNSTFNNSNYAASASYARAFGDALAAGVNLKYIRVDLANLKENAMALDAGIQAKTPIENLATGVTLKNFGTDIGPDSLPLTLTGGVAYKMFDSKLTLATDMNWIVTERAGYWNLGGEYWVTPNLAGRAGYQFGNGTDQLHSSFVGASIGIGLKINRFSMDYAFVPYGDLGNTERITIGLRFE